MSEKAHLRDSFGKHLVKLGEKNHNIVVVSADLEDSTRAEWFADKFPERFFRVGIAEQDMIGMAAGLAKEGFIAFTNSFATFLTNRAYDQIRIDVCYNKTNVKIVCTHAGVNVGEDGATAQCLEDIAIMRVLPNMTVIVPGDAIEARKATEFCVNHDGPVYLRLSRAAYPTITDDDSTFEVGKANVVREGSDLTFIACGLMVSQSMAAAEILAKENIEARVINMHTIKPLDKDAIISAATETGAIVTVEEHQVHGGLGSAVAECTAANCPVPIEFVAIHDEFGLTGSPNELLTHFKLQDSDIAEAAKRVLKKKK